MKHAYWLISILVLFPFVCQSQTNNEDQIEQAANHLNDWVDAINKQKAEMIKEIYANNAIKIISNDHILNGDAQITSFYEQQAEKIASIASLFVTKAHEKRTINYEIISYKTEDLKEYIQLVIWGEGSEIKGRRFEFTAETNLETVKVDTAEISDRRDLWIKLCNAHNAENLINELYSPNTLYYNFRPIIQGRENLVKAYGYMNNENYKLTLEPLFLKVVKEDIAFEIGQCHGSYRGKYVLVWKKEADGIWKIFIDANV